MTLVRLSLAPGSRAPPKRDVKVASLRSFEAVDYF